MADRRVSGGLQTVAAAFDLLDCFVEQEELGVTEVSRMLGIPKSSAHRLLTSLASRGIVEQNTHNAKYRLGVRLYELGNLAGGRINLRRSAQGPLEELRETVGWTVQLSVPSGVDSLVLERLQTVRSLHALPEFRRRLALHVTAQGKVLCAYNTGLAEARIRAGLPSMTPGSITSPPAFRRELEQIRRAGYSVSSEEAVDAVAGVGAPILDARGEAIAAVSIIGAPADILPVASRLGRFALGSARRIQRNLRATVQP